MTDRKHEITLFVHAQFAGMKDKTGHPYVNHSTRVAITAASYGRTHAEIESLFIVGICHDILEDSPATAAELLHRGVTPHEIVAIRAVTNKDYGGEAIQPYDEFIEKSIGYGFLSTVVKFVDVMDNLTRPKHPAFKYHEKLPALQVLAEAMKKYV